MLITRKYMYMVTVNAYAFDCSLSCQKYCASWCLIHYIVWSSGFVQAKQFTLNPTITRNLKGGAFPGYLPESVKQRMSVQN